MLDSQKLQLKLSEIRSRLNEINSIEGKNYTEEIRQEQDNLTTEFRETESRFRAATILEDEETQNGLPLDAEIRELQRLTERASVGDILLATFEKRQTSGEAAELQKHFGLGSHQVPLEMLRIDRGVEERAAATVPDSIGDASQGEVITPDLQHRATALFWVSKGPMCANW